MKEAKLSQPNLWRLDYGLRRARLLLKKRGFSNFDEERILRRYADTLLPPAAAPRTAVDLGAGDGVKGSNTFALFADGWRGLGVECDARRARRLAKTYARLEGVAALHARVTPQGVVKLLREHSIPREFDVLSLDIDSYDYLVLEAILSHFRPRVVVTEINEKIPPPVKFHVTYDAHFRLQHHFYGYSIASLDELAARHGYSIMELEYNNAFLAPRELYGEQRAAVGEIYRRGYWQRPDRAKKFSSNRDVDVLQSMPPAEALRFIEHFFAKHKGKFELGL
ncbi:MAG: hypothetical protein M3268_00970 [Acidobacteriota bacterium]|nr:hypothetical protein [Acidobacteriota bacterium]